LGQASKDDAGDVQHGNFHLIGRAHPRSGASAYNVWAGHAVDKAGFSQAT
jgi:hypothetical protein